MNWTAIWVTCKLASLTSMALLVIGLPIAYWLTFSKWRWKFLVESIVALPLVLPPTVLGFYILVAIGPHSPIGRFYTDVVGQTLPFSFQGLLVASILYSLPFAVQPFATAFEQVDRKLIEASWTLGLSKPKTFFKLIVPLSTAGLITGAVSAWIAWPLLELPGALCVDTQQQGFIGIHRADEAPLDSRDASGFSAARGHREYFRRRLLLGAAGAVAA